MSRDERLLLAVIILAVSAFIAIVLLTTLIGAWLA